jgi:hypothetical protein
MATFQAVRGITSGLSVILDQFGNNQAVSDKPVIRPGGLDL